MTEGIRALIILVSVLTVGFTMMLVMLAFIGFKLIDILAELRRIK